MNDLRWDVRSLWPEISLDSFLSTDSSVIEPQSAFPLRISALSSPATPPLPRTTWAAIYTREHTLCFYNMGIPMSETLNTEDHMDLAANVWQLTHKSEHLCNAKLCWLWPQRKDNESFSMIDFFYFMSLEIKILNEWATFKLKVGTATVKRTVAKGLGAQVVGVTSENQWSFYFIFDICMSLDARCFSSGGALPN